MAFWPCNEAIAEGIQVGGDATRIRIIFPLKDPLTPEIIPEDRTLIVNFPDIIATPSTYRDFFMIKELEFDGSLATIKLHTDYKYKTTLMSNPTRFVVDITAKDAASGACPVISLDSSTTSTGVICTMHLGEPVWPSIRDAREEGRIYLIFDGAVDCDELEQKITRVPFLRYAGAMALENGRVYILSTAEAVKSVKVRTDKQTQSIILDLSTKEAIDLAKLTGIAAQAFLQEDIATVISTLGPHRDELTPEGLTLLARAKWKASYPYEPETYREAAELMGKGITNMNPGLDRERIMLDYPPMLMATDKMDDARRYIRFLRDSQFDEIAITARIQEMRMFNQLGKYDDAFAAGKRLTMIFPETMIPREQLGLYHAAVGDSYLGLSDYPKAMEMYKKATAEDEHIFKHDLTLASHIGETALKMGDLSKARDYILQAINLGDPREKAMQILKLGDCFYLQDDFKRAVEVYSQVDSLDIHGENVILAKLRKAKILMDSDIKKNGKLTNKVFYEILGIYDSIQIPPNSPEKALITIVKIRRAQLYAKHGNWDRAFDTFYECWEETNPEDPLHKYAYNEAVINLLERMRELTRKKNNEEILFIHEKFKKGFLATIKDPELAWLLGQALLNLNKNQEALDAMIDSVKTPSRFRAPIIASLFDATYRLNKLPEALDWNSKYLNDYPKDIAADYMREKRAYVLYRLAYLREAIVYLEPLTRAEDVKSLQALYMLSDSYHRLGDYKLENRTLDRMIELEPMLKSELIEWAMYMRAGKLMDSEPSRAKTLFEKLLQTAPQTRYRWSAQYQIAQILYRQGKRDEARELFTKIVRESDDVRLVRAARAFLADLDLKQDLKDAFPRTFQAPRQQDKQAAEEKSKPTSLQVKSRKTAIETALAQAEIPPAAKPQPETPAEPLKTAAVKETQREAEPVAIPAIAMHTPSPKAAFVKKPEKPLLSAITPAPVSLPVPVRLPLKLALMSAPVHKTSPKDVIRTAEDPPMQALPLENPVYPTVTEGNAREQIIQ